MVVSFGDVSAGRDVVQAVERFASSVKVDVQLGARAPSGVAAARARRSMLALAGSGAVLVWCRWWVMRSCVVAYAGS
jgi:hypothetical protein